MKTDIHERFGIMIKALGLTKNKFAQQLGVASTLVYNIINKRNAPSHDLYVKILIRFPAVNLNWLLVERGPILNGDATDQIDTTKNLNKLKEMEKRLETLAQQLEEQKKMSETVIGEKVVQYMDDLVHAKKAKK